MFFEGPEKKIELHISTTEPSLRGWGYPFWESVVKKAKATVLSKISNENCDAYLLSESSLFVYDHKVLIITCGSTTLVYSLLEVLERIPHHTIEFLSFERKDESYPQLQATNFEKDVEILQKKIDGNSLYLGSPEGRHIALFYLNKTYSPPTEDITIEVLMSGIGENSKKIFSLGPDAITAKELRKKSGLNDLIPGFTIDDHLFNPCGYSLNAIQGAYYYSIHVTPQDPGSYISFETNYPFPVKNNPSSIENTLNKLFSIFTPKSYNLLCFHKNPLFKVAQHKNFELHEEILKKLGCGYYIHFYDYARTMELPVQKDVAAFQLEELS